MESVNHKCKIPLDEDGFLLTPEAWSETVARVMAKDEGVDCLTEEQMRILYFLRDYFATHQVFPILRYVCKQMGEAPHCVQDEFRNPMKAWKIAGLPKPDGIHFVTYDDLNEEYFMEECC
jgi:tRNA 2-thiouridine synthesizing protein E